MILDREITLFDGTRFVRQDRYAHMMTHLHMPAEVLRTRRIFPVHSRFRIVAIAAPPNPTDSWLNNETIHLFDFYSVPQFDLTLSLGPSHISVLDSPALQPISRTHTPTTTPLPNSLVHFLSTVAPLAPVEILNCLQAFSERMRKLCEDPVIQLDEPISMRQLIRIARRASRYPTEVAQNIVSITTISSQIPLFFLNYLDICMLNFMPVAKRQAIYQAMKESDLDVTNLPPPSLEIRIENGYLNIGGTAAKIRTPTHPELIPDVLFYGIYPPTFTTLFSTTRNIFLHTSICYSKCSKIIYSESIYYYLAIKESEKTNSQINSCNY